MADDRDGEPHSAPSTGDVPTLASPATGDTPTLTGPLPMSTPVRSAVGAYEVVREIGRGGMGVPSTRPSGSLGASLP